MTRGTGYIIQGDKKGKIKMWQTCEFNGDMYREKEHGHGDKFLKMLSKVDGKDSLLQMAKDFDKEEGFDYQENYKNHFKISELKIKELEELEIDFNIDYFERFFSDWVFIKNTTSLNFKLITEDNKKIFLHKEESIALNFGNIEGHYKIKASNL